MSAHQIFVSTLKGDVKANFTRVGGDLGEDPQAIAFCKIFKQVCNNDAAM